MRARFFFLIPQEDRLPLAALTAFFFVLSVTYAFLTPPWQHPDEGAHYDYVRHLVTERSIPVLRTAQNNYESHQPPLYYLLSAPLFSRFGDSERTLRVLQVFSALISTFHVVLLALLAKGLAGDRPFLRWGIVLGAAFLPQQLFLSSAVNNDVLANLLGTGILLVGVQALQRPLTKKQLLGAAVVVAAALLTKATLYPLIALLTVVLFVRAIRTRRTALFVWYVMPAALFGGWWLVRNLLSVGDIFGLAHARNLWTTQEPLNVTNLGALFGWGVTLFESTWGKFGLMSTPLRMPVASDLPYGVLWAVSLAALVGLFSLPAELRTWLRTRRAPVLFLAAAVLVTAAALFRYQLYFYQAQGRYLFVALGALSFFFVLGLESLRERLPMRARPAFVWCATLFLFWLTAVGIWTMWRHFVIS